MEVFLPLFLAFVAVLIIFTAVQIVKGLVSFVWDQAPTLLFILFCLVFFVMTGAITGFG